MDNDKLAELAGLLRLHALDDCGGKFMPTHLCNIVADEIEARKLVPVSLDTDTAGLVERLEYTERHGLFDAVVNDCYASYGQAANALRTITAERDALAKRVGELEEALSLMIDTYDDGGWPTATISIARATLKGTDHG